MEQNFGKGAIKDKIDERDYRYSDIAGAPQFDWQSGFDVEKEINQKIPIKDQNGSFSCGGQAWAYYFSILEAVKTGIFKEKSAKYIYAQTFVPGGGSAGRDNSEICVKQGVADETILVSYDAGKPPMEAFMERKEDITDDSKSQANLSKAFSYAIVDTDIESIANAIKNNHGVVLGITGSNNGTWLSGKPLPPKSGDTTWAHWIYAGKVSLRDGKKAIGVLNSWGVNCGEQGWQWIDEDYFVSKNIWAVWTMVDKKQSFQFTKDLKIDMTDSDVLELQKFLNAHGSPITQSGPGSKGSETNYFGKLTFASVRKWQKENKIPDTGFWGPISRSKANFFLSTE